LAAATVGNLALFSGGAINGSTASNVVDLYNLSPQRQPPNVSPIMQNVVANFSSSVPAINISAPLVGVGSSSGQIRLGIMFDQAVASSTTTNTTISSDHIYAVTNTSHATLATFIYQSHLVNILSNTTQGSLDQMYSFSNTSQQAYSTLVIPSAPVKWSFYINASAPFQDGLNMSFSLSDLSLFYMALPPVADSIVHFTTVPYGGSNITTKTTYYLPLAIQQQHEEGQAVAVLDVLDWALIDGQLVAIEHYVTRMGASMYTLVLCFPSFNNTLEYDPSVNLGLLMGQQSSSSSPDLGLIIGTTVGIGGAIVVVLVVIITASVAMVLSKLRHSKVKSVNFDGTESNTGITNNDQL